MKMRGIVRLLCLIVIAAAWLLLGASAAPADNGPHVGTAGQLTDRCAGCHRLHSGQAAMVLVQPEPALCYTCHGPGSTGASTDVVDGLGFGNTYPSTSRGAPVGALRGGGFQYALIDSANPSGQAAHPPSPNGNVPVLALSAQSPVTSSHSVDGSDATAWGNGDIGSGVGATIQLSCTSCHDPHGGANAGSATYRLLRPTPSQSGAATGVAIADPATKGYTTGNYWKWTDPNSSVTNQSRFERKISAWCAQCHTRYSALIGDEIESSGDPIYTYRHNTAGGTNGTPSCAQCHVAHGSNASMGPYSKALPNPGGTPATVPDSRLLRIDNRGTCQMCHNR